MAELWTELRQEPPDPDVLAEGRIVAASSLAETGDLNGAISMLATAGASKATWRNRKRAAPAAVVRPGRLLLAGLATSRGHASTSSGSATTDPNAYDVTERLRSLGPERRAGRRPQTTAEEGHPAKSTCSFSSRQRRPEHYSPPARCVPGGGKA